MQGVYYDGRGKYYWEEDYHILSNANIFVRTSLRDIDWAGALFYDSGAHKTIQLTRDHVSLAEDIQATEVTDEISPNIFASLAPAIDLLRPADALFQSRSSSCLFSR